MGKVSLFNIRLTNLDHDVLVVKGLPDRANSVLLQGNVALALLEPTTVKRVLLKLTCTLLVDQMDKSTLTNGSVSNRLVRFDKVLYEHSWDDLELTGELIKQSESKVDSAPSPPAHMAGGGGLLGFRNKSSNHLSLLSRNSSSSTLSRMGNANASLNVSPILSRNGSSTRLSRNGLSSTLSHLNSRHVIALGNYEIPFSAIFPGSIPETVEGLPGASVVYRMVAQIDKGNKISQQPIIAKKRFRVVRTLTTDSEEFSDSVAVDNTWPNKVEYSLNVPSKAAAIGLGFPVSFNLVPLLKGLRLGKIKMELVEQYSYVSHNPPPYVGERTVCAKSIPAPDLEDNYSDSWDITSFLKVPPSLAKCTQDCEIESFLKVRHKIKFVIGLINPDGHTLELRANLPVQLFISPFVKIRGQLDMLLASNRLKNYRDGEDEPDEMLFPANNELKEEGFSGIVAPPQYQNHFYDRLWDDVLPIESPAVSGAATPMHNSSSEEVNLMFNMQAIDCQKLSERLKKLNVSEEGDEDYFSVPTQNLLPSSPQTRTPIHISRVNSLSNLSSLLERVPSYSEAMRLGSLLDLLPVYEPPRPDLRVAFNDLTRRAGDDSPVSVISPVISRDSSMGGIPINRRSAPSPSGGGAVFTMAPVSTLPSHHSGESTPGQATPTRFVMTQGNSSFKRN